MLVKRNDILGVVLVGGQSSRFGRNKALATIDGETFLEKILSVMDEVFERVVLATNAPEVYRSFGREMFRDIVPHQGPLGGIVTVFEKTSADRLFVVACDMPLLNVEAIETILEQPSPDEILVNGNAVIPIHQEGEENNAEYLMALYHRNLLSEMKKALNAGQLSLRNFFHKRTDVSWLPITGDSWKNINTPDDLRSLEESL